MHQGKTIGVLIAAAGSGTRMGLPQPKQFYPVGGVPIVARAVRAMRASPLVDRVWVVSSAAQQARCREILRAYAPGLTDGLAVGGATRQESVRRGLALADTDIVLVHDAARIYVTPDIIAAVAAAAVESGAAVCGVPVRDTIRDETGTLDRSRLTAVQTPQGFDRQLLVRAVEEAAACGRQGTDEAGLVEALGHSVRVVPGSYSNIKITTREDLPMETRVGCGYDVHRLTAGRPLVLGGVTIPFDRGLLGHSDADVLVHAVIDALLGAACLGDIGRHFPDTEARWKDISSLLLLRETGDKIAAEGYAITGIDGTLLAQRPKVAPYLPQMKENMAAALSIPTAVINLKATTTEGLGFAGREEGMAAQAVCTLTRAGAQ
ncbi:MAG: 2-C-methyl-D-erythritol 4-phosphate cytidylyltransferase [Anaerovoracaceae bacterium]|jgi:2-C-methyl-D-erythritol 4-phosphate cytidylyltransferase/2-C-methyl-D-erythritol 2,4-cyclodiphosphate synthase